jgi:hypothetical protein
MSLFRLQCDVTQVMSRIINVWALVENRKQVKAMKTYLNSYTGHSTMATHHSL